MATMIEKRIEQIKEEMLITYPEKNDTLSLLYLMLNEIKWLKDEVKRLKEK